MNSSPASSLLSKRLDKFSRIQKISSLLHLATAVVTVRKPWLESYPLRSLIISTVPWIVYESTEQNLMHHRGAYLILHSKHKGNNYSDNNTIMRAI